MYLAWPDTRPDPWGEADHPPPPRQPRRRRNAFMLPARLLRQGAVVPGSSDGEPRSSCVFSGSLHFENAGAMHLCCHARLV